LAKALLVCQFLFLWWWWPFFLFCTLSVRDPLKASCIENPSAVYLLKNNIQRDQNIKQSMKQNCGHGLTQQRLQETILDWDTWQPWGLKYTD